MYRYSLLTVGLVSCTWAMAQDLPGPAFEKIVQTAAQATAADRETYFNDREQKWAKRRYVISRLSYDVKKTDSLLNPIVGIASFELTLEQTGFAAHESRPTKWRPGEHRVGRSSPELT